MGLPGQEWSRDCLARWSRPARAVVRTRGDRRMLGVVVRGTRGVRFPARGNDEHARAAMAWLGAAQDATASGGVAAYFDVARNAWSPAYPETTGYIIPTFFEYAAYRGDSTFRERAVRMADWLLTLQRDDGAFPLGPLWRHWPRQPIVFDTGQILQGLVSAHRETGDAAYLAAARRAGDWLVQVQDPDGSWARFDYLGTVHAYCARVAWPLVQLYQVCPEERYRDAGHRNLAWCAARQRPNGWFEAAAFRPGEEPLTHTIAYTIQGLLEGGLLLEDDRLVVAARRAADALAELQARDGCLRGTYGPGWRSSVSWSCLTGVAQMGQIWLRLYELTGERGYLDAGGAANDYLKERQWRGSGLAAIDGGVAGSDPLPGDYQSFQIVNWAAKFFVDSLLLEEAIRRRPSPTPVGPSAVLT